MVRATLAALFAVTLAGCVVAPADGGYGYAPDYGYGYGPGYYAAPTVGVGIGIGGGWHGGGWRR